MHSSSLPFEYHILKGAWYGKIVYNGMQLPMTNLDGVKSPGAKHSNKNLLIRFSLRAKMVNMTWALLTAMKICVIVTLTVSGSREL